MAAEHAPDPHRVIRRAAGVVAALSLIVAAGCSTSVDGAASPILATTAAAASPAPTAEDLFYMDILDTPGLSSTTPQHELVAIGYMICEAIGVEGVTYDGLVTQLGTSKWGPEVAKVVVDAAHLNLCPGKPWDSSAVAATPPAAAAASKSTIPGDGTYEVGVDIEPGKYKSQGSAQGSSAQCYWARLKGDGSGDIIDNGLQNGPQTVLVEAGELFETTRCGSWVRQEG